MRTGFSAGKGRTGVLLIHGLTGTPLEVKPLGDFLARRGYSVLGPWLAGHGTSPRELSRTTWRDWAASAEEAYGILRKSCSKVYVGGLSMGACQALRLAALFPVSGVLSMAGIVRINDFRFNGVGFFRFLQWWTTELTGGVADPKAPRHETYPWAPTKSLYELKKLMGEVKSLLPRIRVPALVVHGRKDSKVPLENARLIYDGVGSKDRHLLYLPNSDHVAPLDYDRKTLFAKTLRFLKTGGRKID